jgi:hypothetical protein
MGILAFLEKGAYVRTYEQLALKVSKSVANVRRYLNSRVVTSINKNRNYVTSKTTVKKKCDHYGFFIHERTGAIFHKKGDIKSTLLYLAKRIDWGISASEAKKRCGRPCTRALKELLNAEKLIAAPIDGERVYFHLKRYKIQLRNRLCNRKLRSQDPEENKEEPPVLPLEEVMNTLRQQEALDRGLIEQLCIIFLQYFEQETYRGLEVRLLLDARLREILHFPLHEVPDHTTIWRIYNELTIEQLKDLFRLIVGQLEDKKVIHGRFLVVDATHIFAWANTHKTINSHEIPGATWGEHQGKFYGYKVHILIDGEAELPVAVKLTHGNAADCDWVMPLLAEAESNISLEYLQAIFGDAAYYDKILFETVREKYQVTLNTTINPRRNKLLQRIKKKVKEIFVEHENDIETVDDALAFLPQTFLTKFGAEVGSTKNNMVIAAIRERLHRHLRSAVERVFSRAKQFFWLERPRTRNIGRVVKHVLMGFMAMLLVTLTATRLGWEHNKLTLARVY